MLKPHLHNKKKCFLAYLTINLETRSFDVGSLDISTLISSLTPAGIFRESHFLPPLITPAWEANLSVDWSPYHANKTMEKECGSRVSKRMWGGIKYESHKNACVGG